MTAPGGPGPGGPGGYWSGDDPGFGVPGRPQPQQPGYQPPQQPPPYQPQPQPSYQHQAAPAPGQPGGGYSEPAAGGGAHGRPTVPASGPHWGRIAIVAGAALVVVAAIVAAGVWIFGGSSGPVDATKAFFKAVQDQDTAAAAAVTCTQAPTLAEQFGRAIKGVEGTLGNLEKVDASAQATTTTSSNSQPPASSPDKRETTNFELVFANGSVSGRATLVDEDSKWKVCFVDLDPPKTK